MSIRKELMEKRSVDCENINKKKVVVAVLLVVSIVIATFGSILISTYTNDIARNFIYCDAVSDGMTINTKEYEFVTRNKYRIQDLGRMVYIQFNLSNIQFDLSDVYLYIDIDSCFNEEMSIAVFNATQFDVNNQKNIVKSKIGDITPKDPYIKINDYLLNADLYIILQLETAMTTDFVIINSVSGLYTKTHIKTCLTSQKISIPDWIELVELIIYIITSVLGVTNLTLLIYYIVNGRKNNCHISSRKFKKI